MSYGRRYAGSDELESGPGETPLAAGKRTLTQNIQRKADRPRPVELAPTPTAAAPLVADQSFVDSILGPPVQRHSEGGTPDGDVHALAAAGTAGAGRGLPFLDSIQRSFGGHDVTGVQSHTDGAASTAALGMGATAFASGNHVAFAGSPDLHTAAHEAAHVVQQRAGVHLESGVGAAGDTYEQHADAVADAVVKGESAEALLGPIGGTATAAPVQRKGDKTPLRDDDTHESSSMVTSVKAAQHAFDMIAHHSDEALEALQMLDHKEPDHAGRDALVMDYSSRISKSATLATSLLRQLPEDKRAAFKAQADRSADSVFALFTWILSRTGNHTMRKRFDDVVKTVDGALMYVGARLVTARPTPALLGTESIEAGDETRELVRAQSDLGVALRDLRDAKIHDGIEPFGVLAALEDNPDPSFMAELIKAILIASLGHISGGMVGGLLSSAAAQAPVRSGVEAAVRAAREAAIGRIRDVAVDSVQDISGKAADGALETANGDKNAKTKARTYFVAGLKNEAGEQQSAHERRVSLDVKAGSVTAASLREEEAIIRKMIAGVGALYYQRASAGWASYLAQQALGKKGGKDEFGRRASNMKDFFGEARREDDPMGDRVVGTSKAKTEGVLHVHFDIDTDPRKGAMADLKQHKVTIEGVNEELRNQILLESGGHISKVWLPKVVSVSIVSAIMRANSFHPARLALDERNQLRDHTEWDHIRRHTSHVADRFYRSPEAFVTHLLANELA